MMRDEVWVNVAGHPGYQVSNLGRVRSVDRVVVDRNQVQRRYKGKVLRPIINKCGYATVHTTARLPLLIHRLVALAFLPPDTEREQVNHKNGNRADNRVVNLEWATNAENTRHSYQILGRRPSHLGRFGDEHHRSRSVLAIWPDGSTKRYASARLAQADGFCPKTIAKVCRGRTHSHKGVKWVYASNPETK